MEKTWEDLAALSRHARAVGKILTSSDALLAVALGLDDSRGVLALGRWVVEAPSRQHPIAKAIRRMLAPVIASRAEHVGIRERWLEYVENAPSYGRRIVQRVRDNLLACIDDFAAKLVPTAKCRIEADVWLWNGYVGEPGLAYAYGARGFELDVHAALRRRCPITEWRKPTLTEVSGGVLTDQLGFSGAHVVSRCLAKVVAAVDPAGSELLPVAIAGHRGADYGVLHVLREVPGQLARTRRGAVGITKRRRLPAIFHLGGWPVPVVRDDLRRALEDAAPFPGVFNPLALRRSEA